MVGLQRGMCLVSEYACTVLGSLQQICWLLAPKVPHALWNADDKPWCSWAPFTAGKMEPAIVAFMTLEFWASSIMSLYYLCLYLFNSMQASSGFCVHYPSAAYKSPLSTFNHLSGCKCKKRKEERCDIHMHFPSPIRLIEWNVQHLPLQRGEMPE